MSTVCPVCRRPAQRKSAPFCSPRCADIDLGRWLTEQYRVPGPHEGEATTPESPALDPAAERG